MRLLNNQSSLFSPAKVTELTELIAALPDDLEQLSQAISTWLDKQPTIKQAQENILTNTSTLEESPEEGEEINKQVLLAALQIQR